MKKKIFKIFIVFSVLLCINNVSARECLVIVPQDQAYAGEYHMTAWARDDWEAIYIKSTETYKTPAEALKACKNRSDVRAGTATCSSSTWINKEYPDDDDTYTCKNMTFDSQEECKKASYTTNDKCVSEGKTSGECVISADNKYYCKIDGVIDNNSGYTKEIVCKNACVKQTYKCSISGGSYESSSCNGKCKGERRYTCGDNSSYCKKNKVDPVTTYGYSYSTQESIDNANSKITNVSKTPLKVFKYMTVDNGLFRDDVYCLQPGKASPGYNNTYCLNEEFDLGKCKKENHYFCGLADILYQTVEEDGTYSDGSTKFRSNGQYDFASITVALRMWVAYAAKGQLALGEGDIITGIEDADSQYISNTNVYLNTAQQAAKGYLGVSDCGSVSQGVLCGDTYTSYIKAIQLFKHALDANGEYEFVKYETSAAGEPEIKHSTDSSGSSVTVTVTVDIPEEYQEKMVECSKQEILNKNSQCKLYAILKDSNGNNKNSAIVDASCGKETCEFTIQALKKQCSVTGGQTSTSSGNTKYTMEVSLKGYTRGGYVRQYVNKAGANATQVMITFAFYEKEQEIANPNSTNNPTASPAVYKHEIIIPCYCDPSKFCDDFRARGDMKDSCDGYGNLDVGTYDSYEKSTYEDPYMNCILNACDASKKEEFKYTDEVGANKKVCNIYCRKELTFYLANKTKVYAGMQFDYDIGPIVLANESDVNNILTTDHKLTSIVLQKRQCTSEIYYDKKNEDGQTWLQQYSAAVSKMLDAWTEWKDWEVLYDWEKKNGGPYEYHSVIKHSYEGATTCGSTSCRKYETCGSKTVYMWPKITVSDPVSGAYRIFDNYSSNKLPYTTNKSSCSTTPNSSSGEVKCTLTSGTKRTNYYDGEGNDGVGCGGTCCTTSCIKSYTCSCGDTAYNSATDTWYDPYNCGCVYLQSLSDSCTNGYNGTNNTLKDEEETAYRNWLSAVQAVEQLYYDLENCNFYVNSGFDEIFGSTYYSDLKAKYHSPGVSPNKSRNGSIKEYLLSLTNCNNPEDCVSLVLGYDDDYGEETKFDKNIGNVNSDLNKNYYCKNTNDNNPNCYKYIPDTEVEVEQGNSKANHTRITCNGEVGTNAKCENTKTVSLPTNDFATFITVTEADFWQPKKYSTSVFTGLVTEGTSAGASNSTPLGNEVFPVSNKSKKDASGRDIGSTGSYDVKHHYTKLGLTLSDKFEYDYACSYDVYNTTKYYDCETNESDGTTNLNKCKNPCYNLVDGVPVIDDSCDIWTPRDDDSKTYGFIYRNVDVGNLFPGQSIRDTGINWSSKQDVIDDIQATASKIYVTDDYLEYRYVLTPNNIKEIREYNKNQNPNGGYLNETLINCTLEDDSGGLKAFTNCKSTFLKEIKEGRFGNIAVSGSKS